MYASLVFHSTREHLTGLVLDSGPDKCVKNHILFVLLIKKRVSMSTVLQLLICYVDFDVLVL